jgi:hypothetical protein
MAGVTGDWGAITAGPCELTLDATSVGHTEGGVEVNYEPELRERVVDELGSTPVEVVLAGERLSVTCRIAQWALAQIRHAIPAGVTGSDYIGIGRQAGYELAANQGKELIIHPLEVTGTSQDVTLWKAVASSPIAVGYNSEGDRLFEVTFTAVAVEAKPDGQRLGKFAAS